MSLFGPNVWFIPASTLMEGTFVAGPNTVVKEPQLYQHVAAGEDRGWLLLTDPHDPTSRYLISRCSAGRSVIDQRARRSLMIRWGSGSKPPRNKPLIYRRAASRGTVSKTIGDQISVTHPGAPLRRNPSIYWSCEEHQY
ncbi:hypothetical protein T11_17578 [Trichinella zimbabwensis]|uniref:Uncharacterized protein n=1 Tax=Trichinella zimbabwensis TaxID=268475 RepID=A0A0V1GWC1_9BILA|nr:hypothetical protein T11_17578 [Trichinella zimbabwensis]